MDKKINIKGTTDGVIINLKEDVPFEDIKSELEQRLKEAEQFFKKMEVKIIFKGKKLNKLEYSQLVDIIINKTTINCEKITSNISDSSIVLNKQKIENVDFYKGTVRSGQCVKSDKHLVILGDVNPSAEIIAEGNVIVLGSLKGNISAGYSDDSNAFVAAYDMQPTLIKIGQVIGRAASGHRHFKANNSYPEIAYVQDNKIVIDPMDYKSINNLL